MKPNSLIIECLNIGPYQVNTYIVACPDTRKCVVIDPGGEADRIISVMDNDHIVPKYILNTHGHSDHVPANASLSGHYQIPICMHTADADFFGKKTAFQSPDIKANYAVGRKLHHDDILRVGNLEIRVLHTPGHTPGSSCFYVNNCLFSGDTLFVGNAGRTDLPGGDLATLIDSIITRLIVLPRKTIVYPGHDYGTTPVSTIGREMKENIYITDFILSPDEPQ